MGNDDQRWKELYGASWNDAMAWAVRCDRCDQCELPGRQISGFIGGKAVMTRGEPIFMTKDVSVRLHERGEMLPVVSSASLEVLRDGCTGIIGESGCGKSLFCRAILGLLESPKWQVEGEVLLE